MFPPVQSIEPITTIIGGPDMYIDTGSTINLTCIVKHLPEPPPGIYWTHNGEVSWMLIIIIFGTFFTSSEPSGVYFMQCTMYSPMSKNPTLRI